MNNWIKTFGMNNLSSSIMNLNCRNSLKITLKINYLLIFLVLLIQLSCYSKRTPDVEAKTDNSKQKIQKKDIIKKIPPKIIPLATCPQPKVIYVPKLIGGLYTHRSEKIDLKPPQIINSTSNSPEAQGVGFFTTFTTDNGLALDRIVSAICDKSGNLWFGTYGGGVSRYDGKNFTNFTTAYGLANNTVWNITEDKNGKFWFGTENGLSLYDGKSFFSFSTDQGLSNKGIMSIIEDKRGNLWIGTFGDGIFSYDGRSFSNLTSKNGLVNDFVLSIIEDNNGNIWIGTKGGVSRYDGKKFFNITTDQGLPNNNVSSITTDKNGIFWFGTDAGLSKYDGKVFVSFNKKHGLVNNIVLCMTEDKSGNLWIGTENGVSRFDGSGFTNFTIAQGLANNNVYTITEDITGNLWFGTKGGGVSRYDGVSFTNFTTAQGLANNIIMSISEDRFGNLWFCTNGGGATCYDGKSFKNFTIHQGLCNNTVWSVTEDNINNLWFGTNNGLSCFNGTSFTNYSTDQGLINNTIYCSFKDKLGNMWFGTENGVSRFDGKSFTNYSTEQGLANNIVWSIAQDSFGNLWFGTEGSGVSCYDGNAFTNYTTKEGLANDIVKCITQDSQGNLWFGTEGGISVITSENLARQFVVTSGNRSIFKNVTTKEGLPNNSVTQIMQNKKGVIYVGTNLGICEVTLSAGGNWIIGSVYNSSTGYPIKDINSGYKTLYEDSKNIIWAGSGSDKTALVRFDVKAISHNQKPLNVTIQNIKVNNENISWYNLRYGKSATKNDSLAIINEEYLNFGRELSDLEEITMHRKFSDISFTGISKYYPLPENLILPHVHNNIVFEFNALVTSRHSLVRYSYMLEGYDEEWSPITDKTSATYGNIFEGTYTFKLKAISPDGVWSEPIMYQFKVSPPWYRTLLMYLIYFVVILILLFLFYRWRLSKFKRENQALEEKVCLRTVQLQQAKERIEEIYKEVTDSINYAKRLQTSSLPKKILLGNYFTDLFILFKPKDVVSGDFYWFAKVEDQMVIAVADCTGHGVPGAFMSILGMSLLKEIVVKEYMTQPDIILKRLRKEIITALGQTGATGEQRDGMDISLCSINLKTLEMQWSGALIPCLIKKNGSFIELEPDRMPIAIFEKMDKFTLHCIQLQKNDIIYLAGDGYHDQFGGPNNKKFMSKRFKEVLLGGSDKTMNEQLEILNTKLHDWQFTDGKSYEQTDDITVLGLKI